MDEASNNRIAQTLLPSGRTCPRWKVMYYIHQSLNGRRDAKNNRVAGTFGEGESPWQFQADFIEQRAELLCRRIARDCPSDLLYYGRPLGLISCVQAGLPAYEYWGKHGFCEYCWVEGDRTKEDGCNETGSSATVEGELHAKDAIGLHYPTCSGQHSSTRALPSFVSSSVIASDGSNMLDPIAAVNQGANAMPTTCSASLLSYRQAMRAVATTSHIWPSLPHAASQLHFPAASLRSDKALVDRRLAALRSSRVNSRQRLVTHSFHAKNPSVGNEY
ncbi:hypothetical protein AC579_6816 [Pseudocercospora musae]|uniref:Uncharacterized protein n=1 Tax=Pseudocercospora musae TaxID=113226 RepID=A0A139IQ11_9PEZI|nr:hypothetical protein AC579_6816 [Pseudocercospora musae]